MPQKPRDSLKELIGRRLPFSGLQNAHIIGVSFYNQPYLDWLQVLLPNVNDDVNYAVLPESERGSAILGVAAHFGNQNSAFDQQCATRVNCVPRLERTISQAGQRWSGVGYPASKQGLPTCALSIYGGAG